MTDKPLAALLRENQFLRDVAEKAIRLRRVGIIRGGDGRMHAVRYQPAA